MGTTPSKALDALLNLLPLSQTNRLDALKSAIRLCRTYALFEGDLNGHLRILKEFYINPLILKNEDLKEKSMTSTIYL